VAIAKPVHEPCTQHSNERESELITQRDDRLVLRLDEFASKLSVLTGSEGAYCPYTSSGIVTGIDDCDDRASSCEYARRRQPRESGTGNQDANTTHERAEEQRQCHV
jgi:hypothetical protein